MIKLMKWNVGGGYKKKRANAQYYLFMYHKRPKALITNIKDERTRGH